MRTACQAISKKGTLASPEGIKLEVNVVKLWCVYREVPDTDGLYQLASRSRYYSTARAVAYRLSRETGAELAIVELGAPAPVRLTASELDAYRTLSQAL